MNAQDLRNSILQLAVQGQLVEQRLEEGTAKDLLKQIRAEKEQLIKEKKIKKEQSLPEIAEDEIPFGIPVSWEWVRLSNIVYSGGQKTPDKPFSYIDIGSIDNIHQKLNCKDNIIEADKAPSRARKIVKYGDVLYATVRPYLHNACIIDREFCEEPIASTGFAVMTCCEGILNKYLLSYLLSPEFDKYANSTDNAKGVAYPAINDDRFYKAVIPVPPLAEQKRIVAKIEEILPYIEQYDKAHTKLEVFNKKFPEDMKKSILQLAMQGKLVEQRPEEGTADELYGQIVAEKARLIKVGKIKAEKPLPEIGEDEIPFEIPKSWKWVRLIDIGEIIGGGTPKTTETSFWENGDIPWLTPADMRGLGKYISCGERKLTQAGLKSSSARLMPKGTVIYSSRAPIGYIGIALNELCTNQGFKSLVPFNTELSEYLYYCLISRTQNIISRASGTTFKEISGSEFGKTVIPLPPIAEQKRIVAKIEEILPCCEQLMK